LSLEKWFFFFVSGFFFVFSSPHMAHEDDDLMKGFITLGPEAHDSSMELLDDDLMEETEMEKEERLLEQQTFLTMGQVHVVPGRPRKSFTTLPTSTPKPRSPGGVRARSTSPVKARSRSPKKPMPNAEDFDSEVVHSSIPLFAPQEDYGEKILTEHSILDLGVCCIPEYFQGAINVRFFSLFFFFFFFGDKENSNGLFFSSFLAVEEATSDSSYSRRWDRVFVQQSQDFFAQPGVE